MKISEISPFAIVRSQINNSYEVYIQRGCLYEIVDKLTDFGKVKKVFVVTDENVDSLYADELVRRLRFAGYITTKFVFEPKRRRKSQQTASQVFRQLFNENADRSTLILNVGGGTVGDLGGFVAALYLRGVRYIHIPTTLMSQADSGVGGKVNVNFGTHLNSLSVFYHPTAVWIDPDALRTLPNREFLSGLAEIVKYAVVLDPVLFEMLENNRDRLLDPSNEMLDSIIRRCIEEKCRIVSSDPREQGQFRLFNYGHEIGHAVEITYNYEYLLHGEAVSIGMVAATWIGVEAGLTDISLHQRQDTLLKDLGLPTCIPENLRQHFTSQRLAKRIKQMLFNDKKRVPDGLTWIIPIKLGQAICTTGIRADIVTRCLRKLAEGNDN